MGGPTRRWRAPAVAVALAAVLAPAGAWAARASGDPAPAVVATTGNDSELLNRVPIGKRQTARPRVVMSLAPEDFEPIQFGDRLRAGGEVQISTTCVEPGPRCVGRNYDINPRITARIVLAASRDATAPSIPLSPTAEKLCKQRRPNRNHHCTLAMPNRETVVSDPSTLPCPPEACFVNMILTASNRHAKRGEVVVVGADEPDGSVKQDKGRLNLVQAHPDVPAPAVTSTNSVVEARLPLTEGPKEKRRVVYSMPLPELRKGEVLTADATYLAGISGLRFNTFVASRIILGETPTSTESRGLARNAAPLRGQITESNGFNCTLGASGYPNPCTVVKAGAAEITRNVVDKQTGVPVTIYLNVVAAAKPLLAEEVTDAEQVSLASRDPGLTVSRWAP